MTPFQRRVLRTTTELVVAGAIWGPPQFIKRFENLGWGLVRAGTVILCIVSITAFELGMKHDGVVALVEFGFVFTAFLWPFGLFIALLSALLGWLFRR